MGFSVPGDLADPVGLVLTTDAETPGCFIRNTALTQPNRFVNNVAWRYSVRFELNGTDLTTRVGSVRIYYKLRVSTPPTTPTFSDVPNTHPFYAFIEALAASGITAGCTAPPNPTYCPNDPLTRGQMAVFLSRALGLHHAP